MNHEIQFILNLLNATKSPFLDQIEKTDFLHMEQGTGVEPALSGWEPEVLPIN